MGDSVQGEAALRDAVSVPPDDRAEVGSVADVTVEPWIAEHDIGHGAGAVGNVERCDDTAIRDDPRRHSVRVGERIHIYGSAVGGLTIRLPLDRLRDRNG